MNKNLLKIDVTFSASHFPKSKDLNCDINVCSKIGIFPSYSYMAQVVSSIFNDDPRLLEDIQHKSKFAVIYNNKNEIYFTDNQVQKNNGCYPFISGNRFSMNDISESTKNGECELHNTKYLHEPSYTFLIEIPEYIDPIINDLFPHFHGGKADFCIVKNYDVNFVTGDILEKIKSYHNKKIAVYNFNVADLRNYNCEKLNTIKKIKVGNEIRIKTNCHAYSISEKIENNEIIEYEEISLDETIKSFVKSGVYKEEYVLCIPDENINKFYESISSIYRSPTIISHSLFKSSEHMCGTYFKKIKDSNTKQVYYIFIVRNGGIVSEEDIKNIFPDNMPSDNIIFQKISDHTQENNFVEWKIMPILRTSAHGSKKIIFEKNNELETLKQKLLQKIKTHYKSICESDISISYFDMNITLKTINYIKRYVPVICIRIKNLSLDKECFKLGYCCKSYGVGTPIVKKTIYMP